MFPLIGIALSALAGSSLYGLYWYSTLSTKEQREADQAALAYAQEWYGKGLDQLTQSQLNRVYEQVKKAA